MLPINQMSFAQLERNINDVFETALIQYSLEDLWEYVCQNNTSHAGDNYHSTRHMREMTAIAYWLLNREYFQEAFATNRLIAYDRCKAMLVACMVHDMNHSLGHEDDDYNIEQALKAFNTYATKHPEGIFSLSQCLSLLTEIEANVRITRFPYSDDKRPETIYQKCIRDADILYSMQKNSDYAVVDALRNEMAVRFEKYRTCSRLDFIEDRMPFLKSCKMFTAAGNAVMTTQIITGEHYNHLKVFAIAADMQDSK